MACPICNKKNKFFSIDIKDYEYDLNTFATYVQCASCKTVYRKYPKVLSKNNVKKYYAKNKYLPVKGNILYDFLKNLYVNYEIKKIYKFLDKGFAKKKMNIIDIACGKGYLIKKISKNKNFNCYGIDENIKRFKKNNLNLIKSSYKNTKLIKKINPNLIIMNNFVEHIENNKDLYKIIKLMKKNSNFVIITPDEDSYARKIFHKFWSGYHSPRHKIIYNRKSLKKFICKVKKIKYLESKLFDPFSNLISIKNIFQQISFKTFIIDSIKAFIFVFFVFIDLHKKNRIIVNIVKK